jgi:dTDP-4-dehydrorhamnose reductase
MGGSAKHSSLQASHDEVLPFGRRALDITRHPDFQVLVDRRPDVVINSAAWTDVYGCAREPRRAMLINGCGCGCGCRRGKGKAVSVQISTNEVFGRTVRTVPGG